MIRTAHGEQVTRRGRIRVPPLAFWANQSLRQDSKHGAYAIDSGFPDQLAGGYAKSSSARSKGEPPVAKLARPQERAQKSRSEVAATLTKCHTGSAEQQASGAKQAEAKRPLQDRDRHPGTAGKEKDRQRSRLGAAPAKAGAAAAGNVHRAQGAPAAGRKRARPSKSDGVAR